MIAGSVPASTTFTNRIHVVLCGVAFCGTLLNESVTHSVVVIPGNKSPSRLPVFKWCITSEHFSAEELGRTLVVEDIPRSKICSVQPIRVYHNSAFVVDVHVLIDPKDVRADENGEWKRTGAPVAYPISVSTKESLEKSPRWDPFLIILRSLGLTTGIPHLLTFTG